MDPLYRFLRILAQWIFIVYGRGRVYGLQNVPRSGPLLLASNHQSFFDPIIAAQPVPRECSFMARDSLFRNRYFRTLIVRLNAFPVKRASADVGAIKESLRRLKSGAALVTFPEGTRTRDGRIAPLHPGVIGIAKRAKCPIVPTIIEGAYEIWPRHKRLPGLAQLWVLYGEPVTPDQIADLDAVEAARMLTDRLRRMHNDLRRRIGRTQFDYDQPGETAEQDRPQPESVTV